MKRILATLIILIVLGAAIFGVGYLPIRLQSGQVAVLYSKTSGWDPEIIEPGVFAWRWEMLIPTNATLYHFPTETRVVRVRSNAILPSADTYQSMLEGSPSLRQEIDLTIRYRARPGTYSSLAPRGLRGESLDDWYQDSDDEINTSVIVFVGSAINNLLDSEDLLIPSSRIVDYVSRSLEDRFPDFEFAGVIVNSLAVPDPQLYRLGRETYRTVQTAREAALIEAAQSLAVNRATVDQRANTLQQYGRIFSDYPVLLEYLEIAARTGRDPLSLDVLQDLTTTQ